MAGIVQESRFYMWRALFAVSHADAVVTAEERSLMNRILAQEPFSDEQRTVLQGDMETHQDVHALFSRITDQQDRSDFFEYARKMVWTDGDYGPEEQRLLISLNRQHLQSVSLSELDKTQGFSFDDDANRPAPAAGPGYVLPPRPGLFARFLGIFGIGRRRWS